MGLSFLEGTQRNPSILVLSDPGFVAIRLQTPFRSCVSLSLCQVASQEMPKSSTLALHACLLLSFFLSFVSVLKSY